MAAVASNMARKQKTKSVRDILQQVQRIRQLGAQKLGYQNEAQYFPSMLTNQSLSDRVPRVAQAIRLRDTMISNIQQSKAFKAAQQQARREENDPRMGYMAKTDPLSVQVSRSVYQGLAVG